MPHNYFWSLSVSGTIRCHHRGAKRLTWWSVCLSRHLEVGAARKGEQALMSGIKRIITVFQTKQNERQCVILRPVCTHASLSPRGRDLPSLLSASNRHNSQKFSGTVLHDQWRTSEWRGGGQLEGLRARRSGFLFPIFLSGFGDWDHL